MKIDVFTHILPPKYFEALRSRVRGGADPAQSGQWLRSNAALSQIDLRLRVVDGYQDVAQVLTLATPPLETLVSLDDAVELARIANDEMAELVARYPDRFIAAVACLPLSDVDAAIVEADRAITRLKLRGVQVFTNVNGEPLDAPRFRPLFARMVQHDLPIWIHPWDLPTGIKESEGVEDPAIVHGLRWPYDTSVTMVRLVLAGVFEEHPNIKFITHHCGGMAPFYERRLRVDKLRKFYGDTALFGGTPSLMCGYAFFGADHLLFGSDMPLGASRQGSYGFAEDTIHAIERMDITAADKEKIFEGNARRLLRLLA
ncbi:MAG: amidohydrolase family protein [Chloroflexi bacterium]|nr:amidohydrolase family protein [Chloroflexota bacterium]